MSENETQDGAMPELIAENDAVARQRDLPEAAKRALAEAEARRAAAAQAAPDVSKEVGGPAGPDPIRYGDWEKGGIASDF